MEMKWVKTFIHIIGIILSFFILDFGYRILLNNDLNFYNVFELSPNLFTFSYISLICGLLYLLNPLLRKIAYISLDLIFCIIIFFEYNQINYGIVLICLLSMLITFLNAYFMENTDNKKSVYNYTFIILGSILCFIFFRGIGVFSLGPEVIRTSGKVDDSPKNVYLYDLGVVKKQEVSGIYEYTFRDLYNCLADNLNSNIKKINDKY